MTVPEGKVPNQTRKPWYSRVWVWICFGVLALALIAVAYAAILFPKVLVVKDELQSAVPLASEIKGQILNGELEPAQSTSAQIQEHAQLAHDASAGAMWRSAEWMPVIGNNLQAARVISESLNSLSAGVIQPATLIDLNNLQSPDGGVNIETIKEMNTVLLEAQRVTEEEMSHLSALPRTALVPQISEGLQEVEAQLSELNQLIEPITEIFSVLPGALGAETPQHYLLIFQNNAEIRTTGGNPAALAMLTVDNGKISISQQASSRDFNNNRAEPIIPLNPETQELYSSRVGTWMQDITFTPDFTETAELMRAFWAESFGTPIDAVISFDPVALSYLVGATGPVNLVTGDVITQDNAVQLLLSDVYAAYPDPYEQDFFFAAATQSIFESLTTSDVDMKLMFEALSRSASEGRLLISSHDPVLTELTAGTPLAGPLPDSNEESTVLGVFLNDLTVGKMDYYLEASVDASSTQCTTEQGSNAKFQATMNLKNTLDKQTHLKLPRYVTADAHGFHGAIHTDVMMYGPIGTEVESVTVNGEIVGLGDRPDGEYRVLTHNGRPVVQVPILLRIQDAADVTVVFSATDDQPRDSFGEFDVRVTPTVHETPISISSEPCG